VALLSGTYLKPHERFFIQNYHLYWTDRFPGRKGGTVVAVKKDIPHNHVVLPNLFSIEAKAVCMQTGNSEVLLSTVCKSPGHAWNGADIIALLIYTHKSLLAADPTAKYPFWNSVASSLSGAKILNLLHVNQFEISASQCLAHYSPAGSGDVLDVIVHKNVRLSEFIASDILDSGHLPVAFHLLDHVRTRNLSDPVETFTDSERFQSLASELFSPRFQINLREEASKAARNFTDSISSAYRISTRKLHSRT
jgi:hypothetical protein